MLDGFRPSVENSRPSIGEDNSTGVSPMGCPSFNELGRPGLTAVAIWLLSVLSLSFRAASGFRSIVANPGVGASADGVGRVIWADFNFRSIVPLLN